jgi:hypothetical protein
MQSSLRLKQPLLLVFDGRLTQEQIRLPVRGLDASAGQVEPPALALDADELR